MYQEQEINAGYGGYGPQGDLYGSMERTDTRKPNYGTEMGWSLPPRAPPSQVALPPYPDSHAPAANVALDDYNCELNFAIGSDGLTGWSEHKDGFQYMWAGGRATHGICGRGKACFECTVLENLPVDMPDIEKTRHVCRVGWSQDDGNLQLGESPHSYGYGGTGKISHNNKFLDYGEAYTAGDTITCYLDLDTRPALIFFAKNGRYLGVSYSLEADTQGVALYPHVNVKNIKFALNFGSQPPRYPLIPKFSFLAHISPGSLVRATPGPPPSQCEILMMVGLPASGKTTWATKYSQQHPEKRYNILGTNVVMERMKVMGLNRKRNYHGRWESLIKQATDILNRLLKMAERQPRNYILDQTNVYPSARRRKMQSFGALRKVAVVVVNRPEELWRRSRHREEQEGVLIPESAVMEMMANFTLPRADQVFDRVMFAEEPEGEATRLVDEYRRQGQAWKQEQKKRPTDGQDPPPFPNKRASYGDPPGVGGHSGYPPRATAYPAVQSLLSSPPGGYPAGYNPRGPPPPLRDQPPVPRQGPPAPRGLPYPGSNYGNRYPAASTSGYGHGQYGDGPGVNRGQWGQPVRQAAGRYGGELQQLMAAGGYGMGSGPNPGQLQQVGSAGGAYGSQPVQRVGYSGGAYSSQPTQPAGYGSQPTQPAGYGSQPTQQPYQPAAGHYHQGNYQQQGGGYQRY